MGTFYAPNDYRNYIAHFGVKGMKWGVRKDRGRRQNPIRRLLSRRAKKLHDRYTKAGDNAASRAKKYADAERKVKTRYRGAKWFDRWLEDQRKYYDGYEDEVSFKDAWARVTENHPDPREYARKSIASELSDIQRYRAKYEKEANDWYSKAKQFST